MSAMFDVVGMPQINEIVNEVFESSLLCIETVNTGTEHTGKMQMIEEKLFF